MEEKRLNDIWIISEGRFINADLGGICEKPVAGPVTEYSISEFAGYLLNPKQISVEELVIGCRIRHKTSASAITDPLRKFFRKRNTLPDGKTPHVEEIISSSGTGSPPFQDEDLNRHFIKINELLRTYDPAHKKIAGLNRKDIADLSAVCEDIGGNRYQLSLQGSVGDKMNYVMNSISKRVNVVFGRAYLSKGLFEMRGFRFSSFNPRINYRLIKFAQDGRTRYCVLNADHKLQYWVNDHELISYIRMLEQSIKTDPQLREVLSLCVKGEAKPLKLFFSTNLDQKYNEKYLPATYRKVFDMFETTMVEKAAVADMLNKHQSIVSFNYVPTREAGRQKLCINISVLHDIKALEPIRNRMPQLYSEIDKKAPASDIGRLYLLDSMRGFQYV
ncbi:MAG: hypothetical protein C4526_09120 [Nitrospiraceae bacterium]|nr:MAG: hypothetical protein C4526_09120 [Nitrospiraceae bacterium]